MAVLSVDLAYRRWTDLGIVVLDCEDAPAGSRNLPAIQCEVIPVETLTTDTGAPEMREKVDPLDLANRLQCFCRKREINILLLDGPQAWKSRTNGQEYARVSERALNTAAKTGLPGEVRPRTYTHFAEFSIAVFNALTLLGWNRLSTKRRPGDEAERLLVESYPHAAWKSLGLKPLPSKRRAHVQDLAAGFNALRALIPFEVNQRLSHDQLQAIAGGLPGLSLEGHNAAGARIVGHPPFREDGHWREGFIVLPLPPNPSPGIRWFD
jgi:hypothetical protein